MKIKQIFALLAASAALASCSFLDEYDPNATTAGNFYSSEADIQTSLNGVYQSLTQNYYYPYNYYFTDVRAHVTVVTDSGASSGIPYQFYNYTLTEENQYVYNRYTQLFKSISRANTLLAHLDDARGPQYVRGRGPLHPGADLLPSGHRVGRRAPGAQAPGDQGRG